MLTPSPGRPNTPERRASSEDSFRHFKKGGVFPTVKSRHITISQRKTTSCWAHPPDRRGISYFLDRCCNQQLPDLAPAVADNTEENWLHHFICTENSFDLAFQLSSPSMFLLLVSIPTSHTKPHLPPIHGLFLLPGRQEV